MKLRYDLHDSICWELEYKGMHIHIFARRENRYKPTISVDEVSHYVYSWRRMCWPIDKTQQGVNKCRKFIDRYVAKNMARDNKHRERLLKAMEAIK